MSSLVLSKTLRRPRDQSNRYKNAGVAQLVEHNLAKVGVEGSSPFSRSKYFKPRLNRRGFRFGAAEQCSGALLVLWDAPSAAEWQSGHAAACKAVYAGSIPASASNHHICMPPCPGGEIGRRKGLKIPWP
jgi:hypothetical protein